MSVMIGERDRGQTLSNLCRHLVPKGFQNRLINHRKIPLTPNKLLKITLVRVDRHIGRGIPQHQQYRPPWFMVSEAWYETCWRRLISVWRLESPSPPIITHRFSIDDFQKGFDAMRSGASPGKLF